MSGAPVIDGETICADGTVIHHLEAGDGQPVVLLPGWSQSARTFESQLDALSRSWRTVDVPLASQQWLARQLLGAQYACVTTILGGTHFPFLENPDAFNDVVADFLRRLG